MAAINEGDAERVNKLLEQSDEFRGVHISGQNSILSHAIFSGNVEVVKALVGAGAQLGAFEVDHYLASQAETQELKDVFIPAIVERTRLLSKAVNSGNLKEVQAILKEGGVGFVDPDMRTSILATAAVRGNVEIVQALVAAGARVEPGAEVEFVVENASAEVISALGTMTAPADLPPMLPVEIALADILKRYGKQNPDDHLTPEEIAREWDEAPTQTLAQPVVVTSDLPAVPTRLTAEEKAEFSQGDTAQLGISELLGAMPESEGEAIKAINEASRVKFLKDSEEIKSEAKKFVSAVQLANQEGVRYNPRELHGYKEWEIMVRSGELAKMNVAAISGFMAVFEGMIGIDEPNGYKAVLPDADSMMSIVVEVEDLKELFESEKTGLGSGVSAADIQLRVNRIQALMGQFYANSSNIQQNVSIKTFVENVDKGAKVMLEQLGMQGDLLMSKAQPKSQPKYIYQPIEQAAATGKLTRVNAVRDEDKAYLKAISEFKDEFNNLIGDRGRESPEYKSLNQEINALYKHFDTQLPGTAAFSMVAQTHINNIQSLMGQFYANNPDVQQHVSIKGFVESISKISKGLLSKFTFDKPLASHISLVLEPIAHAAATGKMERHDSALKNAEDCKYLAGIRSKLTPGSQLAEDVAGSVGKFNVLDKFKLAEIINEDPDRVVRYIQSLKGKGTPASAAGIEVVGKMLDMFTTEATKQKMAYIVAKLEGKEEAHWSGIASYFNSAMDAVKRGVESLTGYNDITDAMNELGIIYNIYGSLFKGESVEVADTRAKGFVGRMFTKSEGVGNVDDLRKLVDGLIGDNGRGSAEYKEFLVALAALGKKNPQYKDNAFQDRLNDVSKAIANLYVANPAVQQHVSLRDFSEGVSKGVQELADGVKNTSGLNVVGSDIKPIESNAKHILIKAIAKQPIDNFNSYGGDARKIDAHNYLAEQKQEVPGVGDAMKRFEAKDNFKLAELINKNPERVMRVIEEMSKQGLLLTKIAGSDEGVEKVATVLNYLSSDKTKENMATILNGLKSDAPVLEFFAQVAVAIEKGINWLTGFDKEVEAAFKEINNIAVMQHDVIAKYEQGAPGKAEIEGKKKEGVKSFVERVSKPSVQGQEIS